MSFRLGYAWCPEIRDRKQFLQVDLKYERVLTGVGARKTDTAKEFLMKYKNESHQNWQDYKENGKTKVSQILFKSRFLRHNVEYYSG